MFYIKRCEMFYGIHPYLLVNKDGNSLFFNSLIFCIYKYIIFIEKVSQVNNFCTSFLIYLKNIN